MEEQDTPKRTAGEAGWHASRYNVSAKLPGTNKTAVVNLFRGTCTELTELELYLLSVVEELAEGHPIIERLARPGIIARIDERTTLEALGRMQVSSANSIGLLICPTMGCNFDCPYCFEDHFAGIMTPEVQDDVVGLARRMLEASHAKSMRVNWYGGEPLLAPQVIESLSGHFLALCEEFGATYDAGIITNGYLLTPENADMLGRCHVSVAQITLDGIGAAHDATRHLVGGGPTYERIVANLRQKLPFHVVVRHNMHAGNIAQKDALEALVRELAQASGNDMSAVVAPIAESEPASRREEQVELLPDTLDGALSLDLDAERFGLGRGYFCGASTLWGVAVDQLGNLTKCWEAVDKQRYSFGTAHSWDPANPIATATNPDNLTGYVRLAGPVPDEECRECIWLPHCVGGCPHLRLFGSGRRCVPYRDDPERFVLAVHKANTS